MKSVLKVSIAFVLGFVAALAIPYFVLASGAIDFAASAEPGPWEERLASWAVSKSIDERAPQQSVPDRLKSRSGHGLEHYKASCVLCHGAPGIEPREFASGLNPSAPDLTGDDVQKMEDGALFWVLKHGIRMTGMPAFGNSHSDEELWGVVAFVRELPDLSAEQQKQLSTGAGAHHDGHHTTSQTSSEKRDSDAEEVHEH